MQGGGLSPAVVVIGVAGGSSSGPLPLCHPTSPQPSASPAEVLDDPLSAGLVDLAHEQHVRAEASLQEFLASVRSTLWSLLDVPVCATPVAVAHVFGLEAPTAVKSALPLRSRRLASQRLAGVPVTKRGEIILMRRLGLIKDAAVVTPTVKKQYDDLFDQGLTPEQVSAIRKLFPAADSTARAPSLAELEAVS
ncbi:hypothetical protein BS78_K229800 [Paspalum vaginatum]|uniref:Uncharacterized protein n=1 Tax=Paspalum vaginatum TaxID=158149 RepID=A0A9W8CGN8_9POAL|nr:hypothetical protein BS78_K229800 [Paspalum vaginatum]